MGKNEVIIDNAFDEYYKPEARLRELSFRGQISAQEYVREFTERVQKGQEQKWSSVRLIGIAFDTFGNPIPGYYTVVGTPKQQKQPK